MFNERKKAGRKPCGSDDAFTLIELLIVLAVISILMAMMLPALLKARESANRLVCMNKERSVIQVCAMYLNDNNDHWIASTPSLWFQDASKFTSSYLNIHWNSSGDYWRNTLLNCKTKGYGEGYNHASMDYVYNQTLVDVTSRGWGGLNSRVKFPSKTPVFGECIRYSENSGNTYFFYCWAWSPADGQVPFEWTTHLNRDNFSFVDGHVSSHNAKQQLDKTIFIWDVRQEQ